MKVLFTILVTVGLWACNHTEENTERSNLNSSRDTNKDSVRSLSYAYNIKDSLILNNTTEKQVDVLFNGVKGYLGGQENLEFGFQTECMGCEPLQAYQEGFLFAKRLYFESDGAKYYSSDINIPDTVNNIMRIGLYGERKKKNFNFAGGKGTMNYQGPSCSDADFINVDLQYRSGSLQANKLINASFFEFDLNKDGSVEQYLLGSRNCSQEVVLLRVR